MAAQNKAWLDAAIGWAMEANAQARETDGFSRGRRGVSGEAEARVGDGWRSAISDERPAAEVHGRRGARARTWFARYAGREFDRLESRAA